MDTGQIITFATLLAGFLYQYFREGRAHSWDVEDRRQAAEDRKADAAETQKNSTHEAAKLHQAIAENTDISVKAFDVANHINEKLYTIGLALVDGKVISVAEAKALHDQADAIQATGEQTNAIVEKLAGTSSNDKP